MMQLLKSGLKVKGNELLRINFSGTGCFGFGSIYLFLCHLDVAIFFYQKGHFYS